MKMLIYALFGATLLMGCQGDDDGNASLNPDINGNWNLVRVTGGLTGVDDNFETGMIVWNFSDRTLEVTNRNTDPNLEDMYETGLYNFALDTSTDALTLTIDTVSYSIDTFTNDELSFGNQYADGYNLRLIR